MDRKQLSLRLAPEASEALTRASKDTGVSANQLIQEAVLKAYGEPAPTLVERLDDLTTRVEKLEQQLH